MVTNAYWIPLFPLLGFVLLIFQGYKLKGNAHWVSIGSILLSCLFSLSALWAAMHGVHYETSFHWITLGNVPIEMGFQIDPLSAMMLGVVSFIGSLIQIFSVGYMHGDPRYHRFFAYLSLFSAAMLGLVLANNFLLLFACWEVVGLCSYLLIGFWFEKPSAAKAAKKAFLVTKVGDLGFFIGLILIFTNFGTFNFTQIFEQAHYLPGFILSIFGFLIFLGAMGKSAQFPLHVWLPDAMEGPTPVSALIHAATMVAAGVYLVGRSYPFFFSHGPNEALVFVGYIGAITALLAATIAVAANDIKKILAYSTISQLGYMMAALGVGGYTAGLFHLMTHAFFKALLFLGAGSVIHGVHTQDIHEMGGLWRKMPITFATFMIGTLALAGIFPLAGFWSKDEILLDASHANALIYYALVIGAFLTAFYMFRLCFNVFFGKPTEKANHAHESPKVMTIPLMILAFCSIVIGWVGVPSFGNPFHHFLHFEGIHGHAPELGIMISSSLVPLAGIGTAWLLYGIRIISLAPLKKVLAPVLLVLQNKYWIDEILYFLLIRPMFLVAGICRRIDQHLVDALVNLVGMLTLLIAKISRWIDTWIVDGCVNLTALVTGWIGKSVRLVQTGVVQNYILMFLMGVVFMAIIRLW